MLRLALTAILSVLIATGAAAERCRQALVLALDVSGSVDEREYRLQLDGLAEALGSPEVRTALLEFPEAPVSLAIFEWSAARYQRLILPWTWLNSDTAIDGVISHLSGLRRETAPQSTGIGAALSFAEALLAQGPACWRKTVDISSDGRNNDWPPPRQVYAGGGLPDTIVNALVIADVSGRDQGIGGTGLRELTAYFTAEVIHGPQAFVELALGHDDFAEAMRRKLLREIETVAVGWLETPGTAPQTLQ